MCQARYGPTCCKNSKDIVGGADRTTVTVKLAVAGFPAKSVAVQVTVVVPIGNKKPDGGVQVTTGGDASTSSIAVGEYICADPYPVEFVAVKVRFGRVVITGGILSAIGGAAPLSTTMIVPIGQPLPLGAIGARVERF